MLRMRWGGFLATRAARRGLPTRVYHHLDACGRLCADFAASEGRLTTVYKRISSRKKKGLVYCSFNCSGIVTIHVYNVFRKVVCILLCAKCS